MTLALALLCNVPALNKCTYVQYICCVYYHVVVKLLCIIHVFVWMYR